ncbi:MAG: methenyltetrahydromethanopterin cyclohydrolase [Gammaproteobacteria bacterium]|nr:methenyltetrahydromethanopterin cyclohydrolase [Gammaproteobacteria bacterium]
MSNPEHGPVLTGAQPSLGTQVMSLVDGLVRDADALRVKVDALPGGGRVVDAGINCPGGLEAGRRITEICMGGLGTATFNTRDSHWPLTINIHSTHPVLACLASQYAGWSLSHGEGKEAFHALGSGPGRALSVKEPLFAELGYKDDAKHAVLVLEVDRQPPAEILAKIRRDCAVPDDGVTIILTPTRSLAGTVQVVGRVLEVALHKVHALGFPLTGIVDGSASAPIAPPAPDFLNAMGRTNDAILFGGVAQLYVDCEDDAAADLAQKLPSSSSRDYGRPFADVFKEVKYDFYKIDPMLFAPARVIVSNLRTGKSFRAGRINTELLARSFGEAA